MAAPRIPYKAVPYVDPNRRPGSVPNLKRGGYNHGGPSPLTNPELARAIATQDPIDQSIYEQEEALKSAPALAFEWSWIYPPASATPIELFGRAVVLPWSPTAAMSTSASELKKANLHPAGISSTTDGNLKYADVTGAGAVDTLQVPANHMLVIDEFGVDAWSLIAEYELMWGVGVGVSYPSGAAPSATDWALELTRGWRQGSIDKPAKLKGYRVIKAQSIAQTVSLVVYDTAQVLGTYYTPAPHYVEAVARGWYVPVDADGHPVQEEDTGGGGP